MMFKVSKIIFFSVMFVSVFSIFSVSKAQYDDILDQIPWAGNTVSVRLVPEAPTPGESARAVVEGSGVDLDRSNITWYLDNVKQISGIGKKQFSFTASNTGKKQTISVSVVDQDGTTLTGSTSISPGEVSLVWEARSYTPPFYKGKALFPYQGSVVVSAQPSTSIDPDKLIYKWEYNGNNLGEQSGYGKQSIEIATGVIMRGINIKVTVTSLDGVSYNATASINIPQQSPKPILYSNSPIYGMLYNIAKSNSYNLTIDEIKIKAEPYYFSVNTKHSKPDLGYVWGINGEQSVSTVPDTITLRKPGGSGQTMLSVEIKNDAKMLQFSSPSLLINY